MKKIMLCTLSAIIAIGASSAFAAEQAIPTPSQGEAQKGRKMFEENDTNKDGSISKDEWRARGDKMFSETDTNGDGKLTQDETKAHYEKKRAAWKERRMERKEQMGEAKGKLINSNAAPTPTAAPAVAH